MNVCLIGDGLVSLTLAKTLIFLLAKTLASIKVDIPLPIKHTFIIKI